MSKRKLFVEQIYNGQCDLSRPFGPDNEQHAYSVKRVVNAVRPEVHERLTKAQLEELCNNDDWEVTIT